MSYPFPPDVQRLVHRAMSTGAFQSEDDLLRDALTAWQMRNEDMASIRAGIADMEAGRMRPFEDAVRDFDQRHGSDE